MEVAALGHVIIDTTLSKRQLSSVSGLSRTIIQRIWKSHKFKPYKIRLLQELNEDAFNKRLELCELMS